MSPAAVLRASSRALTLLLLSAAAALAAPRQVPCPNGEKRFEIDVDELAIRYEGSSISTSLAGLGILAPRLRIDPQPLQKTAAATQQWNELLKGLAEGWNKCILTKEDFKRGLDRIYPRLKEDAADLEKIRQEISRGQQVNEKQIRDVLESINANLRVLARMGNRGELIERITAVEEKVEEGTAKVIARIDDLERKFAAQSLAKPDAVRSTLNQKLHEKAELADREYRLGYESFKKGQRKFADAIPHFERALNAVPLPEFYEALSSAYLSANRQTEAEKIASEGLGKFEGDLSDETRLHLETILGLALTTQGKFEDAVGHLRYSLDLTEKLYGAQDFRVAMSLGGLAGAYSMTEDRTTSISLYQRALEIYETSTGLQRDLAIGAVHMLLMEFKSIGDFKASMVYSRCAFLWSESRSLGYESGYFAYETARSQRQLGDLAGEVFTLQEALASMRSNNSRELTALLEAEIGRTYLQVGDLVEAIRALERAQSAYLVLYGPSSEYVMEVARDLQGARKQALEIQVSF